VQKRRLGRTTTRALPTGLVQSPVGAATGAWGPLLRSSGDCSPMQSLGMGLPLVAPMPQWLQNYPDNPCMATWAAGRHGRSTSTHRPPNA
jgi:hypothetical protein